MEAVMTTQDERQERIEQIQKEAQKVFGSLKLAKTWLSEKNIALGTTPNSLIDTEQGAREVRKVLSAIAHGGVV